LLKLLISRRAFYWLLTLVWAAQIYQFSTARYSPDASWSLLEQLLQKLLGTVSPSAISVLNLIARKLAHLIEYSVLTLLLYRSLVRKRPLHWRPNVVFLSIGITSLYALSDEFHQLFVPGRHAAAVDWGIDLSGAVLAMFLLHGYLRRFPPRAVATPSVIEITTI
jgi:VanZ family protein